MVDRVTVPIARASILWLIGEYSDRINKLAPDVLRKMAKSFPDEVCHETFSFDLNQLISLGNYR